MVVIGSSTEEYLFHFAEVQSVLVVRPELHEAHIARLRQLRYAFYAWEKSVGGEKNEKQSQIKKTFTQFPEFTENLNAKLYLRFSFENLFTRETSLLRQR